MTSDQRHRAGQRRRHRQLAVFGVLGQGGADGEEADRQDRHEQRLGEVDEDVGAERVGGEQAGDRRVERRVAGEEGAHPLARPFAGFRPEGGADGEGAEQQAGPGDEDVVEDRGRELVAAEQRHRQRVAEVAGVDAEHRADHRPDLGPGEVQDPGRHAARRAARPARRRRCPARRPTPWLTSMWLAARLKKITGGSST